jgi:hypothetical protein
MTRPRPASVPTEWRIEVSVTSIIPGMLVCCVATAAGQVLTKDPPTGLPLIAATDSGARLGSVQYIYNEPIKMPDGQVCKSKMQADFYKLYNITLDATVAWYAAHLSGFKKVSGYASQRSQTAFCNSDRTLVVIVTGNRGASGENTNAYSVAYEHYQPGLSEKTVASLTEGTLICQ